MVFKKTEHWPVPRNISGIQRNTSNPRQQILRWACDADIGSEQLNNGSPASSWEPENDEEGAAPRLQSSRWKYGTTNMENEKKRNYYIEKVKYILLNRGPSSFSFQMRLPHPDFKVQPQTTGGKKTKLNYSLTRKYKRNLQNQLEIRDIFSSPLAAFSPSCINRLNWASITCRP